MDIATLIGLVGSVSIVALAMILGGSILVYINAPSMLIVVGGTIMVVMMKFSLGQFINSIKIAVKAFVFKVEEPSAIIELAVKMANAARKGGLLTLEDMQVDNPFMKKGVQYLVDGLEPDVVKATLNKDMNENADRHELGQKIFQAIGDVGPAMGMIGTLIGLVQMLSTMEDPKTIGPAMAIALLTTLYGSMIANMIALPIADKLELRSTEEKRLKALIIDALMGIQSGQNPRVIEELLKTYLPTSQRGSPDEQPS